MAPPMNDGKTKCGQRQQIAKINEPAAQAKVFGTAVKLAAAGRSGGVITAIHIRGAGRHIHLPQGAARHQQRDRGCEIGRERIRISRMSSMADARKHHRVDQPDARRERHGKQIGHR